MRTIQQILALTGLLVGTMALPAVAAPPPGGSDASSVVDRSTTSSPFTPPEATDNRFVVNKSPGLDTSCTFSSGGPLLFDIPVDRVIGDRDLLLAEGLLSQTATLEMPGFDVDFDADLPGINPERDRVLFNGQVVPGEFLIGQDGTWVLNSFQVPTSWVEFPSDPGSGGTVVPAMNQIEIQIDTANATEEWCTAVDWASLNIAEIPRPVVLVHGIFSSGDTWVPTWVPGLLQSSGIPASNELNMGNLDGIVANAGKIAAEVTRSKARWGVDRLNLVAHSKGGLDSREYAELNPDIEQLIQIATPNAGSPLADAVQGGALILVGAVGTIIINDLAGPAGVQLTRPYMAVYNRFHGANPATRYRTVGGLYDPDCAFLNVFCRPIERLLLTITGPGDTIVPLTSVQALSYTIDSVFPSSGANKQATHTEIQGAGPVFNLLQPDVGMPGGERLIGPDEAEVVASVTGVLEQDQTIEQTFAVDSGSQTFIAMFYPSGDFDLALTSPNGTLFTPQTIASLPDVSFEDGEISGGRVAVYDFASPEIGVWTASVTAPAVTTNDGMAGFAVNTVITEPEIRFDAELVNPNLIAGQSTRILATPTNLGAPILDAQVTARVQKPDNTVDDLVLRDDGTQGDVIAGDGVYSAELANTFIVGGYGVVVQAQADGSGSTVAFSRMRYTRATVASNGSDVIVADITDQGVDENGNSLFERLAVDVPVTVPDASRYRLTAVLRDNDGNTQVSTVEDDLVAGANTIALSFAGALIFERGVDGPYSLASLSFAQIAGPETLPIAELTDVYATQDYTFDQFERETLRLTGDGSEQPIDTNQNGLFDVLTITVDLETDVAGTYTWSAQLVDDSGSPIAIAPSRSQFFSPGVNTMTFSFEGEDIGQSGRNGPYGVSNLLLFGGGLSLIADDIYETEAYLASQFEGFVPPADGDLNMDGAVDRADFDIIRNALGNCVGNRGFTEVADLNGDGCISYADYALWYQFFLAAQQ